MSRNPLAPTYRLRQREHVRVRRPFFISLDNEDLNLHAHGITANLSQHGAFIRVESYHHYRPGTETKVTLFLPPEFSGQNKLIGLQGMAVVSRIDQATNGLAVQFYTALRQFQRVEVADRL